MFTRGSIPVWIRPDDSVSSDTYIHELVPSCRSSSCSLGDGLSLGCKSEIWRSADLLRLDCTWSARCRCGFRTACSLQLLTNVNPCRGLQLLGFAGVLNPGVCEFCRTAGCAISVPLTLRLHLHLKPESLVGRLKHQHGSSQCGNQRSPFPEPSKTTSKLFSSWSLLRWNPSVKCPATEPFGPPSVLSHSQYCPSSGNWEHNEYRQASLWREVVCRASERA